MSFFKERGKYRKSHVYTESILGEEDAKTEWANIDRAVDVFLHTDSYNTFTRRDMLFLFGRRGTGKTSILKMFHHEVRKKINRDFNYSWLIENDDSYRQLTMYVRGSELADFPEDELVFILRKKWLWIFKVSAMQAIIYENKETDDDLKEIKNFLFQQQLIDSDDNPISNGLSKLVDKVGAELEKLNTQGGRIATTIINIIKYLEDTTFKDACKATGRYLKSKNCSTVILLDSIDRYGIKDNISRASVTGLVEAINEIYTNSENSRVLVKVALPSELYPHMSIMNQEKTARKLVFILCRHKDLVSFIAKRYCKFVSLISDNEVLDELDTYEEAESYLQKYFPKEITTSHGIRSDTLVYIIRHTQKKPRQILYAINTILTICKPQNHNNSNNISEEDIVIGVHTRSDILVKSTFEIYDQIYPYAHRLIKNTLFQRPNVFTWKELDLWLKEVSKIRGESKLNAEEIKRLLIESGVVGRMYRKSPYKDKDISLLMATFEYQIKGTIVFSPTDTALIHPMFYDEFESKIHTDYIPYPVAYETEEEELLKEQGILF